jgi:hypothetical protein
MLNRYLFILLSGFLSLSMKAQTICPSIDVFDAISPTANSLTVSIYQTIIHQPFQAVNTSLDFGDGTAVLTGTQNSSDSYIYIVTSHTYASPGNYSAIYSINVPITGCSSNSAKTISVTNAACSANFTTSQTLSTGYDRANNMLFTSNAGNPDPYWFVQKQQQITGPPLYSPIAGTETFFTNVPAYDVVTCFTTTINANYININSNCQSQTNQRYLTTYRTYFNLPATLPANNVYNLYMNLRADDAIHSITLNGNVIKAPGYIQAGNTYSGPPLTLNVNSCNNPGYFVTNSNYIDISVADAGLAITHLVGEILLQQCASNCSPPSIPCENCIGSFSPTKDKKYVLSLWAREDGNAGAKTTFTAPEAYIDFPSSSPLQPTLGPFTPSGAIIDGWQRIEAEFYLPPGTNYSYVSLRLNCNTGDCNFDDIRIFPYDGSIKTYVYDGITLRLSAELDERNYATLYEYDEEGKLVRVKKETEKGIMTIQENKNNTVKKP